MLLMHHLINMQNISEDRLIQIYNYLCHLLLQLNQLVSDFLWYEISQNLNKVANTQCNIIKHTCTLCE